jgi:hypothetical protein
MKTIRLGVTASAICITITFQACATVATFHPPYMPKILAAESVPAVVELPGIAPGGVKEHRYGYYELSSPPGAAFVTAGDRGFIIVSDLTKVAAAVDLKGMQVIGAFRFPETEALFLLHKPLNAGDQADDFSVHLSRIGLTSGKMEWTSHAGVHTLFSVNDSYVLDVTMLGIGLHLLPGRYIARSLEGGRTILLGGLVGMPSRPRVRLMRIDAGTGAVTSEEYFHIMRRLDDRLVMFIAFNEEADPGPDGSENDAAFVTGRIRVKVMDISTGRRVMEARLDPADLPVKPGLLCPHMDGFDSAGSLFLCEVRPVLDGKRLSLSPRCVSNDGFGNKYNVAPVVVLDMETGKKAGSGQQDAAPIMDLRTPNEIVRALNKRDYYRSFKDRVDEFIKMKAAAPAGEGKKVKAGLIRNLAAIHHDGIWMVPVELSDGSAVLAVPGGEIGKTPAVVQALFPVAAVEKGKDLNLTFWGRKWKENMEIVTMEAPDRLLIYKLPPVMTGPDGRVEIKVMKPQQAP